MNFADLKTKITDEALLNGIQDMINEEKQRGIEEVSKRNRENQNLRKFKQSFDALGYTEESDLDKMTADLIKLKTQRVTDPGAGKLTLDSLNEQITTLTRSLQVEREQRANDLIKVKKATLSEKLTQVLDSKVYGSKFFIQNLIDNKTVDMENDSIVVNINGEKLGFDAGIAKLLEQNKDIVKAGFTPGTDTRPGTNTQVNSNIQDIINSGDSKKISENIGAIASQYGITI